MTHDAELREQARLALRRERVYRAEVEAAFTRVWHAEFRMWVAYENELDATRLRRALVVYVGRCDALAALKAPYRKRVGALHSYAEQIEAERRERRDRDGAA